MKVISLAKGASQLFLLLTGVLAFSVVTPAQKPTDPALIPKFDQAQKLYSESDALLKDGRAESKRAALPTLTAAAEIYKEIGSKADEARTLHNIGGAYDAFRTPVLLVAFHFDRQLAVNGSYNARQGKETLCFSVADDALMDQEKLRPVSVKTNDSQ